MKTKIIVVFLLLIGQAQAELLVGSIWRVIDGDTLIISGEKVRIVAIDAPEIDQEHGPNAKLTLDRLVKQKVTVEYYKQDRYGRILGRVYIGKFDLGLHQVLSGNAWFAQRYKNELGSIDDVNAYNAAHNHARSSKRGLWQNPDPIAPWDYRKR